MKLFYRSVMVIVFVIFYSTICNSQVNNLDGKYEYSESGMNATQTRSWTMGYYLQINSKTNQAVYFSEMNSDIQGLRKFVYQIKYTHNQTIELLYEKCIGFDDLYAEETDCVSYDSDKAGDKHFVFKITNAGLQLLWDGADVIKKNSILKKVDKFYFEE